VSNREELLILAVESSATHSAVALLEGERLLAERGFPRGQGGVGAGSPAEAARQVLEIAGRRAAEVGLVAVSAGPGSYTGLRIGVSFAKTFAWATGATLAAVPSLAALAEDAAAAFTGSGILIPTADAFRGQLYARAFRRGESGKLADLTGDLVLKPSELIGTLGQALAAVTGNRQPATGNCCFGSGAAKHAEDLRAAAGTAGLRLAICAEPASPSAATVGRIGLGRFLAGKTVTAHDLAPVYLRKTEAEERLEARQGKKA
jgi:tRNA threonylcarbamoyladenosine biosynthesis protein TsaB